MHTHEQAAADHAGGMEFGKIFFIKSARLEQHHGEGVTERQHHRRTRSRREIERTCFLLHVYIEKHMGVLREGRFWIAAKRDDSYLKTGDCRQDPEQFLRLAARA